MEEGRLAVGAVSTDEGSQCGLVEVLGPGLLREAVFVLSNEYLLLVAIGVLSGNRVRSDRPLDWKSVGERVHLACLVNILQFVGVLGLRKHLSIRVASVTFLAADIRVVLTLLALGLDEAGRITMIVRVATIHVVVGIAVMAVEG